MSVFSGGTPPFNPNPSSRIRVPVPGPPVLPHIPGTFYPPVTGVPMYPPWIMPPVMTEMPPPEEAPAGLPEPAREYPAGPFCFGLDKVICEQLPRSIRIGGADDSYFPGFDLPLWGFCGVLLNTLCGIMVAIILLTLLSIAFYGLVQ